MTRFGLQRKLFLAMIVAAVTLLLVLAVLWYVGTRSQLELVNNTAELAASPDVPEHRQHKQ
ncbi:MAG: hypothetical protein AAGJ52_12275 [Pseudomonadota bacterium]